MSSGHLRHRLASTRFDVAAAVLGLLISLALFPLRFFSSQIYIRTIPLVLGGACLLYLYSARRETKRGRGWPTLAPTVHQTLPIAVFVGLAVLVVVGVEGGGRTTLFLDIAGVVGTLLFVQIAFVSPESFDRTRLLVQIVLLAAVVRFVALYTTPGLIGIDSYTHITQIAENVYETGTLESISGNKHYTSPLYHVLVAVTSMLGDVTLRLGLYLSVGLLMPLSVLLVFAIGNLLVDERWAAFGALAFALADYVIEWGIHLIPTSMGLALFLGVTYWLVRLMLVGGSTRTFWLVLGSSVAVILTHQISSFIMLVLLGSALLAYLVLQLDVFGTSILDPNIFRHSGPVNLAGLLVFDAGLIMFLWSLTPYNGDTFLLIVTSYLAETLSSSASFLNLASAGSETAAAAGAEPTLLDTLVPLLNVAGFLLLMFIGFLGCLYVVHRHRARQSTFTLLIAAAVMMVFSLGLPIFGIRNFVPQRWFAFMYLPLVILGIIGLRYLADSVGTKLVVAVVLVFALVFPTVMVVSMNGAIDKPTFDQRQPALSYSAAELEAVETVGEITGAPEWGTITEDQLIYTDHPYKHVWQRSDSYAGFTATINDSERATHDVVVYRTAQSEVATFFDRAEGDARIMNIPKSRLCRPGMAEIYNNGEVTMCVESPAT